jgi:hypothetical protein
MLLCVGFFFVHKETSIAHKTWTNFKTCLTRISFLPH